MTTYLDLFSRITDWIWCIYSMYMYYDHTFNVLSMYVSSKEVV